MCYEKYKIYKEGEQELLQKTPMSAQRSPLSHLPSMATKPVSQGNQSLMFHTSREIKAFNLFLCLKTKRT